MEAATSNRSRFSLLVVISLGFLLLSCTIALAILAQSFPYDGYRGRPIREVVIVLWIASAFSLAAIVYGLRIDEQRKRSLLTTVFTFAIACRLILLFSSPILEVDFYRYLWDGIVSGQGVSPYKFSPDTVLNGTSNDPELIRLQEHIAARASAKTVATRVHFEEFTTLYPPVSQFMFRTTTALVPDNASVWTHIVAIKSMLVLFDIGVIFCLAWIIGVLGKHPAWLIAWAWNPLVLKEIANGGHLDSIAVFFFIAGISAFLWFAMRTEDSNHSDESGHRIDLPFWIPAASGALIGLGIGAKLFPVVITPVLVAFLLTKGHIRQSAVFVVACTFVSILALEPMINQQAASPPDPFETVSEGETSDGLAAFMTHWRMNDAVFSFVYQNVEYDWGSKDPAWYVFVPNETRKHWCQLLADVDLANGNPAYLVARIVTVVLFGTFYLWVLFKVWNTDSVDDLANYLFLVMAVFFFLQPTQNPWYWLWAMPLVCFAKNRGWLFVSMALVVYYLRFWFDEKNQSFSFFGSSYVSVDFFDHCVVWIEFLSVVAVLLACRWLLRPHSHIDMTRL